MHSKCSRENCSLQKLWANRLHMEILTRSRGKLRPERLKEDGPFTVTSSRYRCRSLKCAFLKTTDLGIWLLNENVGFVYLLQVCKYVYISIPHLCKENFENTNWWKLCKNKQFIYHCLFPPTVSLSWFFEKMDIWGPKYYKKPQVVDSLISVFPHGPSAWIYFQAKSPDAQI